MNARNRVTEYRWLADGPFAARRCAGMTGECTRNAIWVISPYGKDPAEEGIPLCGRHIAPISFKAIQVWESAIVMQAIPRVMRKRSDEVHRVNFDGVQATAAAVRTAS